MESSSAISLSTGSLSPLLDPTNSNDLEAENNHHRPNQGVSTANTTNSTHSLTTDNAEVHVNVNHNGSNKEGGCMIMTKDANTGKAPRRVSFTTATTMEEDDPLSCVVVVDSQQETSQENRTSADNATNNDDNETNPVNTPSPKKRWNHNNTPLTPEASSQTATPHHSNIPQEQPQQQQQQISHQISFGGSGSGGSSNGFYYHSHNNRASPMSPQQQQHPFRRGSAGAMAGAGPNRRRSSLDSCSTYSSGGVSSAASCYSQNNHHQNNTVCAHATASLASALSFRDEAYQRSKLLDCLEWLGRHVSKQVVQQLIEQVQQERTCQQQQQQPIGTTTTTTTTTTTNTATNSRMYPTTRRRMSLPSSSPRRGSMGSNINNGNNNNTTNGRARRASVACQPRRHSLDSALPRTTFQSTSFVQGIAASSSSILLPPTLRCSSFVHCDATPYEKEPNNNKDCGEKVATNHKYNNHGDGDDDDNVDDNYNVSIYRKSLSRKEHEDRRQRRLLKTQESLDRLSSNHGDVFAEEDAMFVLGYESTNSVSSWGDLDEDEEDVYEQAGGAAGILTNLPQPQKHRVFLLLVDISGFTKLSTTLPLQSLSETINAYFQRIILSIQEYGGDVVKFAGDAVFAEWRQRPYVEKNKSCKGREENCDNDADGSLVRLATTCACQIVERCSDYNVYKDNRMAKNSLSMEKSVSSPSETNSDSNEEDGDILATLNVHCGIGYGSVIGLHVGDDTKREYLLLGDPITQASEAITLGRGGEVVASPQAYQMLLASLNSDVNGANCSGENAKEEEDDSKPRVIFSSRRDRLETTPDLLDPAILLRLPPEIENNRRVSDPPWTCALTSWDVPALVRLEQLISLYVHPLVVDGELFTSIYHNRTAAALSVDSFGEESSTSSSLSSRQEQQHMLNHDQQLLQSEAELRKVFTLFLQPILPIDIKEDPAQNEETMTILNQIMILVNRELARFRGHLRQFIVDDKGVVMIANFGLRGSAFPDMIEEHAMPFAASIQSVLRSELNIDCRIGATSGTCYCGVVGGLARHEYSVLGPAVNLAARLMGNPQNQGFLVAEGVQEEAHSWQFRALEPVQAKGYADPVPIFEPIRHTRSPWAQAPKGFVGRQEELEAIVDFVCDGNLSDWSSGKMVLVSAPNGFGKSSLLSEAVDRIRQKFMKSQHSQLILGQVCCEDDLFQPLSVLGPVLLDILSSRKKNQPESSRDGELRPAVEVENGSETAIVVENFYSACRDAEVPYEAVESLFSLVFHHKWTGPGHGGEQESCDEMSSSRRSSTRFHEDEIARLIVSIFLKATVDFDLVLLGIDDVSLMDKLSWKVVQLWFEHACNMVMIGTSNPVSCRDINISPRFWDYLFNEGTLLNRFIHIELFPMTEGDIELLIIHHVSEANSGFEEETKGPNSLFSSQKGFAREIYLQSGGNPRLVAGMVERFALDFDNSEETIEQTPLCENSMKAAMADSEGLGVSEHVLHRMDNVPAVVRTHLNLGAILGESFSARDVINVMEIYRGVPDDDKEEHAEFVQDCLHQAVWHGILTVEDDVISSEDNIKGFNATYRFAHELWREKILQLTLDSWQSDMHKLIDDYKTATTAVLATST